MNDEIKTIELRELQVVESNRQYATVRFSRCGKFLFTAGYDAAIRCWDVADDEPRQIGSYNGHHGWVTSLVMHPGADLLFSTDSWGQLGAWDYSGGSLTKKWSIEQAHDGWIRTLALGEDGALLATAGRDKMVRVWSSADGQRLHELAGHDEEVYCVAIHPSGKSVVSGDLYGNLKRWDLDSGKCDGETRFEKMHFYERIQDVGGLRILQFRDDGQTLVCAGAEPTKAGRAFGVPTIHLVDWESLEIKQTLHLGPDKDGYIFDMAWHPGGYVMLVTSGPPGASRFLLQRPEDEEPLYENKKMYNCHSLAFHGPTNRIVVAATNRSSQGNGAVLDKQGSYLGNSSPLHLFELAGS